MFFSKVSGWGESRFLDGLGYQPAKKLEYRKSFFMIFGELRSAI